MQGKIAFLFLCAVAALAALLQNGLDDISIHCCLLYIINHHQLLRLLSQEQAKTLGQCFDEIPLAMCQCTAEVSANTKQNNHQRKCSEAVFAKCTEKVLLG